VIKQILAQLQGKAESKEFNLLPETRLVELLSWPDRISRRVNEQRLVKAKID
jgi:hypothetical protein